MSSPTNNFSWIKPTVGSDNDVWGDYLNTNLDNQDSLIRRFMNTFINSTEPTEKQTGTQWIDNSVSPWPYKIYDGTAWVTTGTINPTTHSFTPIGVTFSFYTGDFKVSAQTTNHGNWLLCNGQNLNTTTYSALFALIGYSFGGSGTTFSAPDLRGQTAGGIGTGSYSGASTRTLGQFVGAETHTLTIPQIPSHSHTFNPQPGQAGVLNNTNSPPYGSVWVGTAPGFNPINDTTFNLPTGGSGSHNNMQPTLFAGNYFIYGA